MGVEREAQSRLRLGCVLQERFQLRIYFAFPITIVSNVSFVEYRHEIDNPVAAIFKTIKGVFKRLNAINTSTTLGLAEQVFSRTGLPKGRGIEVLAALCHPMENNVIVYQCALVRRDSYQAYRVKNFVEALAETVERLGSVTESKGIRQYS